MAAASAKSGEASSRDASGGLARAGTLQNVANVLVAVLERAREIRVSRAWTRNFRPSGAGCAFRHLVLGVHGLLPVDPVAVANEKRDRRASRPAVPHTGEHFHLIAFNGHSPAASVAALPSPQLCVERVQIDVETGRHAVDRDDERLTV
jgi:hypothetical protein